MAELLVPRSSLRLAHTASKSDLLTKVRFGAPVRKALPPVTADMQCIETMLSDLQLRQRPHPLPNLQPNPQVDVPQLLAACLSLRHSRRQQYAPLGLHTSLQS